MNKSERRNIGNHGELIALKYLQEKDYAIIATNYTIPGGEIDIIAQKDDITIFIEVRYRTDESHAHPLDTFTLPKRRAMRRTVMTYIAKHHIGEDMIRIDFIGIMPKKDGTGYRLWHERGVEI
ncbi:MAG: YraN family protein [Candidatus Altimarinota bacterium]